MQDKILSSWTKPPFEAPQIHLPPSSLESSRTAIDFMSPTTNPSISICCSTTTKFPSWVMTSSWSLQNPRTSSTSVLLAHDVTGALSSTRPCHCTSCRYDWIIDICENKDESTFVTYLNHNNISEPVGLGGAAAAAGAEDAYLVGATAKVEEEPGRWCRGCNRCRWGQTGRWGAVVTWRVNAGAEEELEVVQMFFNLS
jgi:hypothetical protein